jgi:hypothetical protein
VGLVAETDVRPGISAGLGLAAAAEATVPSAAATSPPSASSAPSTQEKTAEPWSPLFGESPASAAASADSADSLPSAAAIAGIEPSGGTALAASGNSTASPLRSTPSHPDTPPLQPTQDPNPQRQPHSSAHPQTARRIAAPPAWSGAHHGRHTGRRHGRGSPSSPPASGNNASAPGPLLSSGGSPATPLLLSPPHHSAGILVTGPDAGGVPLVKVFDPATLHERFSFLAYDDTFRGGVRVAVADVNGDGTPDIITGTGPGGGSEVRVFDGTNGQPLPGVLGDFNAYAPGQTDGVFVAAADVNGDGHADIITGTDVGGQPLVKVFSGADGSLLALSH